MPSTSLTGKVLNNKWKLGALVGTGACADVYEATDVSAGAVAESGRFVAKVAPVPVDLPARPSQALLEIKGNANLLYWEYTLYQGYLRPLRELGCVVEVSVHGRVAAGSMKDMVIDTVLRVVSCFAGVSEVYSQALVIGRSYCIPDQTNIIFGSRRALKEKSAQLPTVYDTRNHTPVIKFWGLKTLCGIL